MMSARRALCTVSKGVATTAPANKVDFFFTGGGDKSMGGWMDITVTAEG
jgi:hypothetical protein